MKGPVLVTGGAGSVGRRVTERLLTDGYAVRIFDLPGLNYAGLEGRAGIEIFRGDLTRAGSANEVVKGASAVVHLAALLPPVSERKRELTFAVNVDGTARLAEALAQANPDAHLIFSSSVSTYGDTSQLEPPVRTSNPQNAPLDIYAESKIAAEKRLRKIYPDATVLRISGVSVPAILAPPEVWPFMAGQRLEFVHRDDVMAALCAAVATGEAKGKVFNIAGGATWRITGRKYVEDYYKLMGAPVEEARFIESPGYFDWYDTAESQRILHYQNTSYPAYLDQLGKEVEKMMQ